MVVTSLGVMAEPFTPFQRRGEGGGIDNFDATEELRRIDDIQYIDLDKAFTIFGSVHGGNTLRVGR